MKHKHLLNGPLTEAIFEIFWMTEVDDLGFPIDPEFDLAQGIFAHEISREFKVHKRIQSPNGIKIFPKPVHQFWKGELEWPVVQLGPGILAVNQTNKDYTWEESFRPTIHKAINILRSSYQKGIKFKSAKLRYLNTYELGDNEDYLHFIENSLSTKIVNNYKLPGALHGIKYNQTFKLEDNSFLAIETQTVINNQTKQPAVMWGITCENQTPLAHSDLCNWLDSAHNYISETFVNMINKDLYAKFNR